MKLLHNSFVRKERLIMIKTINVRPCLLQNYYQFGSIKTINKPVVGSLLCRITKESHPTYTKTQSTQPQSNQSPKTDYFVVVEVRSKKRGNNKGITDGIFFERVIDIKDGVINYNESNYAMILTLTNHGDWWGKDLLKNYDFVWDPEISENPIIAQFKLSSPLRIPSSPISLGAQHEDVKGLFSSSWSPSIELSNNEMFLATSKNKSENVTSEHRRHSIGVSDVIIGTGTSKINMTGKTEVNSNVITDIDIIEKSSDVPDDKNLSFNFPGGVNIT